MKLAKRSFAFATITLLLAQSASPWPGPALDLDRLTAEASLIAVGQIMSVQEIGKTTAHLGGRTFPARAMAAELRVDRVLKGAIEGSSPFLRVRFVLPDEFIGWRSIAPLSYRVFFLTESSGEFYPSVVATSDAEIREGTAIERIIAQLGTVLESNKSSPEEKREAVYALDSSKNPAAIRVLKQSAEVKDDRLRVTIVAALLEHNDISALQFAENTLLKPDAGISSDLLHSLSYGILMGVNDKRAVPSLARLLHASSIETRRAAASALMHVGSTSCIDPLLTAIGDSDFEVRYYGVVGLAEITGQMDWRPNMEDFKSDQNKYLTHWSEWSQSNRDRT